jgi:hypothetical protein
LKILIKYAIFKKQKPQFNIGKISTNYLIGLLAFRVQDRTFRPKRARGCLSGHRLWFLQVGRPVFYFRHLDNLTFNYMKKFTLGLLTGVLLIVPTLALSAPNLVEKLKGKILLAVEDKGKTYYVANDGYRYRVTSATAQKVFEKLGVGITNNNLSKIPEKNLEIIAEATTSQQIIYQEKIVEKIVYLNNCNNSNTSTPSPTNNTQSNQVKETYNNDTFYPIILSLKDDKGNTNKSSQYNGYSGNISYTSHIANTTLKIGNELVLTVEAKDPQGRPLFYNWNSNSQRFNALIGIENGDYKYTSSNELHYKISSDDLLVGEKLRIVARIKSEKSNYRFGGGGYDDSIFFDYKLTQY